MTLLTSPAPSLPAVAGFVALVLAVTGAAVAAAPSAAMATGDDSEAAASRQRRVAAVLAAWLALTWAAAASGVLGRFDAFPPPILPFVALTTVASTVLAFSSVGSMFARGLPIAALVGFQAFRVPLEIILHQLGLDGVLPVQMTYDGMNYDIVSGVTAIAVALWAAYGNLPRFVLRLWNILGLTLLLVIVTIAILSAPVPFRVFMNEPANTIIATTPFVWLPTVLVQAAWIGHLLVFRRLRMDRD